MEIVVLYSHSLLAEGVASLLRREHLEVREINLGEPEAMEKMRMLTPQDIVILDTSECALEPSLSIPLVLGENPHVVVVALTPQDNKVEIYRKQEMNIAKPSDLAEIIKGL